MTRPKTRRAPKLKPTPAQAALLDRITVRGSGRQRPLTREEWDALVALFVIRGDALDLDVRRLAPEGFILRRAMLVLAEPIICGMSQAANDWCDRHVDAINEPNRAIPSGRMPGRWSLWTALVMTGLSLGMGTALGPWGFLATCVSVAAAQAYSAELLRLKRGGVWGPGLVGLCYEGLPWVTGAAVLSAGAPPPPVVAVAALYAVGAHGIMTLNNFKALEGDWLTGIASLPVTLGPKRAARLACAVTLEAQGAMVACLCAWNRPVHAGAIALLALAQVAAMRVLLRDPAGRSPWYNGTGVAAYVAGMMVAALALRGLG